MVSRRLASLAIFAVPLIVYLLTMPPGITWANSGADGGDLITAAVTLGVPHPHGYPTYVLIGWLFSNFPVGEMAWRFNLLSAVSVAGAAWLLFKTVTELTESRVAGLVAGWSLAFVPLVWSQAIIAEVYGVNLFFVGLLTRLILRVQRDQIDKIGWLGLAFGLALGTHLTILFLVPAIGRALYQAVKKQRWQTALPFFGGLLIGLAVFAYHPWRAFAPTIVWGEPGTWAGFWSLISGELYRGYFSSSSMELLGQRTLASVGFVSGFGAALLALMAMGLLWGWRYARILLLWTVFAAIIYVGYALFYGTFDSYVYLIPALFFGSLWIGLGVRHVLDLIKKPSMRKLVSAGMIGLPLVLMALNFNQLNLRNEDIAENFWRQVMRQVPMQAVLLTEQDKHAFTLWYARYGLAQRPDVVVVDTRLIAYPWHRENLRHLHPDLTDADNLTTIFEQRGVYHRPLCVIAEGNLTDEWAIDCLD